MNQERLDYTPIMLSIPETAKRTGLSQYSLRKLANRNEIPCFYSGKKTYINYPMLLKLLNDPERVSQLSIPVEQSS